MASPPSMLSSPRYQEHILSPESIQLGRRTRERRTQAVSYALRSMRLDARNVGNLDLFIEINRNSWWIDSD